MVVTPVRLRYYFHPKSQRPDSSETNISRWRFAQLGTWVRQRHTVFSWRVESAPRWLYNNIRTKHRHLCWHEVSLEPFQDAREIWSWLLRGSCWVLTNSRIIRVDGTAGKQVLQYCPAHDMLFLDKLTIWKHHVFTFPVYQGFWA